jgi:peptide-methionine (S)-S-oxide reductase
MMICLGFAFVRVSSVLAEEERINMENKTTNSDANLQSSAIQEIVLAGGCFWGMEELLRSQKGVFEIEVGYAGGDIEKATYNHVKTGATGNAESVQIKFDASVLKLEDLLEFFFKIHDPTTANRQGNDIGTQYRSAIFFANSDQKKMAESYIKQLTQKKVFPNRIVTEVSVLKAFYPAEEYHQNFIKRNPTYPYVVVNDLPKLEQLKKQFPDWYRPN